jgi:LysR family transcriptional regulator, transcriptional activator for bauABCD operon
VSTNLSGQTEWAGAHFMRHWGAALPLLASATGEDPSNSSFHIGLPRLLHELRRTAPAMFIDFMVAGPEELEAQLMSGKRDIIITPSLSKRPDLWYQTICNERQSLYCGGSHPLFSTRVTPTINELSRYAIVARGYLHSQDLKRLGHREAEATVEMMEGQLILILSGSFLGYLPAHYAAAWVKRGELRCLDDSVYGYDSTFFAVAQRSTTESSTVRRFLSIITTGAGSAPRLT